MTFPPETSEIVLVEDDPGVRDALQFSLRLAGYSVRAYARAENALSDTFPRPACLVVDQRLGANDGLELIRRLRDQHGAMPAVLIASYPGPALRRRAGAADVAIVEKPLIGGRLLETIGQMSRRAAGPT